VQRNDLLERLREDPARTGLFLDVDGTLAPIVVRPEDARVPDDVRLLLRSLATCFGLVACISGRPAADAERVVGVDELVYVGTHGLELTPEAESWREQVERFAETVDWPPEWTENKGLTIALHYRQAEEAEQARHTLERIAEQAEEVGLFPRFGRMVLEILPPLATDKGTAVRRLLDTHELRRALYAGDDTTDLDAFRALDGLELAVRVAVVSGEAPVGLVEASDISVTGPDGLSELLRSL